MVESIYFLKPAWCGIHFTGLWPEQGLQPVTRATAFEAVVCHFCEEIGFARARFRFKSSRKIAERGTEITTRNS
jgi:hypothetical protein